jgi:hypothetical protein
MIQKSALTSLLLITSGVIGSALPAVATENAYDRLSWPVDCVLGQDCFIQNYLDRDPGPETRDVGCGRLTYDGHKGTDIALPSIAAQARGVTVRAAAPGVIQGVRNGMPDRLQGEADAPDVTGRECGNGVAIRQADGLLALYCHMKRGSITVSTGEAVQAGTVLGQIGLSGQTTFPHLHFELLHEDTPIDPFAPDPAHTGCAPADPLWQDSVRYVPGGLLAAGLASGIPDYGSVKRGLPTPPVLDDPQRLFVWGFGYGVQKNDVISVRILGPQGVLMEERATQEKPRAQFYHYFGILPGEAGWPKGIYRAEITLRRDGETLGRQAAETRID